MKENPTKLGFWNHFIPIQEGTASVQHPLEEQPSERDTPDLVVKQPKQVQLSISDFFSFVSGLLFLESCSLLFTDSVPLQNTLLKITVYKYFRTRDSIHIQY